MKRLNSAVLVAISISFQYLTYTEVDVRAPRPDAPGSTSSISTVVPQIDLNPVLRSLAAIRAKVGNVEQEACDNTVLGVLGDACTILEGDSISQALKDIKSSVTTIEADISSCGAPTSITQDMIPYTISSSGRYCLAEDVTVGAGQTGITFAANNVILDLNEHQINGGAIGIALAVVSNCIIKNGIMRGQTSSGVEMNIAQYCTIDNVVCVDRSTASNAAIRFTDSCSYIDILNCKFHNNAAADFSYGIAVLGGGSMDAVVVQNCEFNAEYYGIYGEYSMSQWKILNCMFQNCVHRAIEIIPPILKDFSIHDCIIEVPVSLLNIAINLLGVGSSNDLNVQAVDIQRTVIRGSPLQGMIIRAAAGVVVRDCVVSSCLANGIQLVDTHGAIIERCESSFNGQHGIFVTNQLPSPALTSWDVAIHNCRCIKNGTVGLEISSTASTVEIYECDINGNTEAGVVISGDSCSVRCSNVVDNGTEGITIASTAANTVLEDNTVMDNASNGISIASSAVNVVVHNNSIVKNAAHGIVIEGVGVTINGCSVLNNTNNGLDLVSTASGVVISHCEIVGNGGSGIVNDGQTQIIVGNSIVNNGEQGIDCTSSSGKTYIHNNTLVSNGGFGIINTSASSSNTIYRNFANRNNGGNYSGVTITNSPGGALAGTFDDFIANVSN